MIRLYALIAACVVALGLGGYAWAMQARAAALRVDLDAAERALKVRSEELDRLRLANDVLDAHLKRETEANKIHTDTIDELRQREGYNAPLSDFLRDTFERL